VKLKIALLQIAPESNNQEANRRKGLDYCYRARELGADVALFPEMWNIGYTSFSPATGAHDYDPYLPAHQAAIAAWQAQAIEPNSAFVESFRHAASELEMAIVLTYLEQWPGAPRNSAALIDRRGEAVLTYAKVHTCDFSLEAACTPGEDFPVCELDTAAGPVKIGLMICYDREFPETARILMLNGAEIILTPNACDLEENRLAQFRTRAFENMVGVAMTNYPGAECRGRSVAYSPVAFDLKEQPLDTLIVEAGAEEGIWLAEFDLEELREYRRREAWGDAFRKPARYGRLLETAARAPFVRKYARR
jgi:predicted amidohydrolase